ncbi:MAG: MBL fold metallo-hydrolase [Candidatus Kerfeldbacteria bacterium]
MADTTLRVPEYLTWFGHDSVKIVGGGKVIFIDPFQLKPPQEPADLVLITHEHFDHYSEKDLAMIVNQKTTIVAASSCNGKLPIAKIISVQPGERHELDGITIETVPAYNLEKPFHPNDGRRVGFIITIEGQRIYHAGDTDFIPEMRLLSDIDVALVPVSGTYVMDAEEAAEAVNSFMPRLAIPMHYGAIVGSSEDAERFKQLARVPVVIPKQS